MSILRLLFKTMQMFHPAYHGVGGAHRGLLPVCFTSTAPHDSGAQNQTIKGIHSLLREEGACSCSPTGRLSVVLSPARHRPRDGAAASHQGSGPIADERVARLAPQPGTGPRV